MLYQVVVKLILPVVGELELHVGLLAAVVVLADVVVQAVLGALEVAEVELLHDC
jgi:hypothetical protein